MKHKFFKPAVLSLLAFLTIVVFFSVKPGSVSGQESAGPAWDIRCGEGVSVDKPEKGKCEIFQKLVVTDTGQRLAEFALGYNEGGNVRGVMILPLGILLETGVVFRVDENEPFAFSPRYCDAGGCVAFLNMNEDILAMLRKGENAVVTMKALNGSDINIVMSLKGFSKAFKKIS